MSDRETVTTTPDTHSRPVTVLLGDPRLEDATKIAGHFAAEDEEAFARMKRALGELEGYRFRFLEDHDTLLAELAKSPPFFALNFCDTGFRNQARFEPHVAAFLEMLDVPYSGAPPACLALCYDKAAVRGVAAGLEVPVPAERFLRPDEATEPALLRRYPVLIKPNRGDGSVGITQHALARDAEEAAAYVARLRRDDPRREVLVQEFLPGKEVQLGLVGNPGRGFTVLPPLEVDFGTLPDGLAPILCFESKADPESPYYTGVTYRRARLADDQRQRLVTWCERLFARLGCRDYARFDFRHDSDGTPRLLEVNPNPAWCWDGKMALMAGFAELPYRDLLRRILETALERCGL